MTSEIKKDSTHTNLFPGLDKYANKLFTQEEKDRIERLARNEILDIENSRGTHEIIVTVNKDKPKLKDEQKQADRDHLIHQHVMVVEMFAKELEILENILKKLE